MSSSTILTANDIDYLFLRLSAMYGHLWKSLYRDEDFLSFAKQEWLQGLQEFNRNTLEQAVAHCKHRCDVPPSLPRFYQLCKEARPRRASVRFVKEKVVLASPERVEQYLDEIYKILRLTRRMKYQGE